MRRYGSTVKDIEARRRVLQKIISGYQQSGKMIKRDMLLRDLAEKGFYIDMSTLYRDRGELNKSNTFIEDLAHTGNYSAYVQEIIEYIHYVEENAKELFEKKLTSDKIIIRKTKNGESTERHHTREQLGPKIGLLNILMNCQKLKVNMFEGDTINTSVMLLGKKFGKFREELGLLKCENDSLKTENYALRSQLEKTDGKII